MLVEGSFYKYFVKLYRVFGNWLIADSCYWIEKVDLTNKFCQLVWPAGFEQAIRSNLLKKKWFINLPNTGMVGLNTTHLYGSK